MVLRAVQSALAQTAGLVEVIVVVDGPDPETEATLAGFAGEARDGRLRILPLPYAVGGAEARNLGVRHARAGWIAFLDDDDVWVPHKLAVQLRTAEQCPAPEPVVAASVFARSPRADAIWPRRLYATGSSMAEYLFCRQEWTFGGALLQTSTLLAPRSLLLRVPFAAGLRKHQDWDWLLRVSAESNVRVVQVPEPLAIFHVEGNRSSVGRLPDWRFSRAWAEERRALFTPRAFAGFLATECAPQAAQCGAALRERAGLLREVVQQGSPSLRLFLVCLSFLLVPQPWRRAVRDALRTWAAYLPGRSPAALQAK